MWMLKCTPINYSDRHPTILKAEHEHFLHRWAKHLWKMCLLSSAYGWNMFADKGKCVQTISFTAIVKLMQVTKWYTYFPLDAPTPYSHQLGSNTQPAWKVPCFNNCAKRIDKRSIVHGNNLDDWCRCDITEERLALAKNLIWHTVLIGDFVWTGIFFNWKTQKSDLSFTRPQYVSETPCPSYLSRVHGHRVVNVNDIWKC